MSMERDVLRRMRLFVSSSIFSLSTERREIMSIRVMSFWISFSSTLLSFSEQITSCSAINSTISFIPLWE